MHLLRRTPAAVALVLAAAAVAPVAVASGTAGHKNVVIKDIDFKPGTVTIKKGQTVRWTWRDGPYTPHNVTFRSLHKHSPTQETGTYSLRFTKKGTYKYLCTVHLNMTGKVVVR